jgi:hypothetical protein
VGKGAQATCPPSIIERALKGWARFRLRSLSYGGQVALPPYDFLRARKRNLDAHLRQINTTGKSLLIFRNRVKPENQKYSA